MANRIETEALRLSEEAAAEQGVYVVDVTYGKENGKKVLCFYIDKEGGVGIDDCERFSGAVERILDEADLIREEYSLDVSSPGVDRKLSSEREFKYYIGRDVDVKLYAASDGAKEFTGVLTGFDNGTALIETEKGEIELPVKDAAYIRLSFRF